eukprot:15293379-Heterocapsa_arctica.AAC.1
MRTCANYEGMSVMEKTDMLTAYMAFGSKKERSALGWIGAVIMTKEEIMDILHGKETETCYMVKESMIKKENGEEEFGYRLYDDMGNI